MSNISPARPAHERALRAWAKAVISARFDALAGVVINVTYSNQKAPRRTLPYVDLLILTDAREGGQSEVQDDWISGESRLERSIYTRRAGTVTVSAYGQAANQTFTHRDMINRLIASLEDPDTVSANSTVGLAVRNPVAASRRMSVTSNNVTEDRSVVDLAFAYTYGDIFNTDANYIDTVETDPTYNDPC